MVKFRSYYTIFSDSVKFQLPKNITFSIKNDMTLYMEKYSLEIVKCEILCQLQTEIRH